MNLEIHHQGQNGYLDNLNERFKNKIQTIKNSKLLTPISKKVRIKLLKQAFLKEKKETDYFNF